MRIFIALLFIASVSAVHAAASDDPVLTRGAEVYRASCATGYCHGVNGAVAGAPRLAARGFSAAQIANIVQRGVPGTPMTGFAATLPADDLQAVMTYVAVLNGLTAPVFGGSAVANAAPAKIELQGSAARGRSSFTNADKSTGRCSSCHEVEALGLPVAPLAVVPASVAALRALATPAVHEATFDGETMPALLLGQSHAGMQFYDMTAALPVLRTVQIDTTITWTETSTWRHDSALAAYNDDELAAVLDYLRAVLPIR